MAKGAERREGTKESGLRQTAIVPRLSSPLSSCLSWLRWHMVLLTCRWYNYKHERMRKKYCERGYHKFMHATETISYRDKKKTVDYINCPTCGLKFFSTIQDKRKYLAMTSRNRKIQARAWKGIHKLMKIAEEAK